MSAPDLDHLRQRWQQAHQAADPRLELDVAALRAGLLQRSQRAFARHSRWLLAGLLGQAAVLVALLAFLATHWQDPVYRLLATPLALLALAQVAVSLDRWWTLRRLDLAAPVLAVRARIERLRRRQLRLTRWIVLCSVLLWLPLLLVLLKGITGFDLLAVLHPSVLQVNLLAGLFFLLLGDLLLRWIARRHGTSPALRRFLVEVAGRSWQRAEQAFDSQVELDAALERQDAASVLARYRRRAELPARLQLPLRRLQQRLLLAACLYGALLLALGLFNASHGGQPAFLVPGVLLNFCAIVLMATAIQHRASLARLDFGQPAIELGDRIEALASSQLRVARVLLWLAPVVLLLLAQVLMRLASGANLLALLGSATVAALAALALLACLALARPQVQARLGRGARVLLLGAAGLSAALRRALD